MKSHTQFDPSSEEQWFSMAQCCTSLFQCMPDLDARSQFQHYQKIISYSDSLAKEAQKEIASSSQDPLLNQLQSALVQPGLIATFHYGQYGLLPLTLSNVIPLTILISNELAPELIEKFKRSETEEKSKLVFGNVVFLVAEKPGIMREVQQHLKQGRYVLFFVDGNSGVLSNNKHSSDAIVPLLEGNLRVRTGIAQISYLSQSPIYTIVQRSNESWQLDDPIRPVANEERRDYVAATMKQIYGSLNQQLLQKPEAWEAWFYLHGQFLPKRPLEEKKMISANTMVPFLSEKLAYLMDKETQLCYSISPKVYLKLKEHYWGCINNNSNLPLI